MYRNEVEQKSEEGEVEVPRLPPIEEGHESAGEDGNEWVAPRTPPRGFHTTFAEAMSRARRETGATYTPAVFPPDSDPFMRREIRRKRSVANSVLERVLANLGVLGEIEVGDKLDFTPKGTFVIQKPTWLVTATRFLKGCDRWQTFDQVETLVGTAENMVDEGSFNDPRVREALLSCIHGLRNLQRTYSDDAAFKFRMEVLIQRIGMRYQLDEDAML